MPDITGPISPVGGSSGGTLSSPTINGKVTGSATSAYNSTFNSVATDSNVGLLQNVTITDSTPGWTTAVVGVTGTTTYTGTATPDPTSHAVGTLGWSAMDSTGVSMPLMEGVEGRVDNLAGTLTTGICGDFFTNTNVGTMTNWYGTYGYIGGNSGTIGTAYGHAAAVLANTGTITIFVGFYNASNAGISGIANRFSFYNADPIAPSFSMAPIIDDSVNFASPTTGTTYTVPNNTTYQVFSISAIAALTLTFPAAPIDGQELLVKTTGAITTLTMSGNTGHSIVDPVTTLATNAWVRYKYYNPGSLWYRIG